jgi:tetratricopeptide (TPR) repeat protein
MHAENDVVEFIAETGLLGLAALLFAAWRLRPALAAALRSSALGLGALAAAGALAVHSLVDFNLRVPSNALVLAVCLALALPERGRSADLAAPAALRLATASTFLALGALACCAAIAAVEHARGLGQPEPLARVATLTRALQWNPLSPEIRRDRARALVRAASGSLREIRLERGGEDYRRVLALRPRWAEAWYELAWVELARGDRSAARSALQRATALDPTSHALRTGGAALLARIDAPAR